MKSFFSILALGIMASPIALAFPNPSYTTLDEPQYVTQYVAGNMSEIIDTSRALAAKAIPNAGYFLITSKVTIFPPTAFSTTINEGASPIATLTMSSGDIECERDVFSKLKHDAYGGKIAQSFFLTPAIRCVRKASK